MDRWMVLALALVTGAGCDLNSQTKKTYEKNPDPAPGTSASICGTGYTLFYYVQPKDEPDDAYMRNAREQAAQEGCNVQKRFKESVVACCPS